MEQQTAKKRLEETLRRNSAAMRELPEWVRDAINTRSIFGPSARRSASADGSGAREENRRKQHDPEESRASS